MALTSIVPEGGSAPQRPKLGFDPIRIKKKKRRSESEETHNTAAIAKPNKKKKKQGILSLFTLPSSLSCKRILTLPAGPSEYPAISSTVTGTLFGYRHGHIHFSVQEDPKCPPTLLLELASQTSTLIKEMACGLVKIALECDKSSAAGSKEALFHQPLWSMYCNGRKAGYAVRKSCCDEDMELLSMVQAVSMGAGVLPRDGDKLGGKSEGELMYMRAKFERVVGSKDSEAFYMMNPDGRGGPELSIFLLRV